MTSFSRLQKEREHGRRSKPGRDSNFILPHFEARAEDDFEETREADEPESIIAESPASSKQADPNMLKLPGGASTGNFLHEILERIDYAQVLESTSTEEWAQNSGVRQQLTRIAEKHGFSEESLEEASSLVWHTLTRSIRVGESSSLKLAECEKRMFQRR